MLIQFPIWLTYMCWGLLGIFALVTLAYMAKNFEMFVGFMKIAAVMLVCTLFVATFKHDLHMATFGEIVGGSSIVWFGGAAVLFDVVCFAKDKMENSIDYTEGSVPAREQKHMRHREQPTPQMEVLQGEVVEDYPQLRAHNPQQQRRLERPIGFAEAGPSNPRWSDWQTCENSQNPHWHTWVDGESHCEFE